ncbi:MAG: hypothetical protein AAGA54_29620 [Myxococcota bacterium]
MKRALASSFAALLLAACASQSDTADPTSPASQQPADAPDALAQPADDAGGLFAMAASDVTIEPAGCRPGDGGRGDGWTFEMAAPQAESWMATEHYGTYDTPYECTGSGDRFTCAMQAGFDYTATGVDANVSLEVRYDGGWTGDDAIGGDFELEFSCSGAQCDEVAGQWGVASFPCENAGRFEGTR